MVTAKDISGDAVEQSGHDMHGLQNTGGLQQ